MKKLLSAVLCAALIITAMPMAYAASISDVFGSPSVDKAPIVNRTVKADANMLVMVSGGTYADGPLTIVENPVASTFDFKVDLDMANVETTFKTWIQLARGYAPTDTDYQSRLDNARVKGNFTVEITYPNALTVPAAFTANSQSMYGFTASPIFREVSRTAVVGADTTTLTISVEVYDSGVGVNYVKALDMENDVVSGSNTYLADMSLECTGVLPAAHGTYTVTGKLTGNTTIWDDNGTTQIGNVTYNAYQTGTQTAQVSETITVSAPSTGATNVSGGTSGSPNRVTVDFVTEGDVHHTVTKTGKVNINVDDIEEPTREGFAFAGWYAEEYYKTPVSGDMEITEDTTLHAKWINTTVPSALNDDRAAYVIGYPDGDVRPESNITREEIATIFYRLLKKEIREELYAEENAFADVDADRWSNKEISTMANGKYIQGYEDGTFRPEDAITRGEFVTIAARFLDETVDESYKNFKDIDDHWAEEYIHAVADQEWIGGYEDGTFRPDALITRAEAMTIINRMLVYHIDHESLIDGVKHWPDNNASDWFYFDVLAATNTRDHDVRENGYTEDWVEILPNPDWSVIK